MTTLPNLQRALVDAAAELDAVEARPAPTPRRRRRGAQRSTARVLAIAVVVALALAAIAFAATGLLQRGSDVAPRSGRAPRPTTALGVATGMIAAPITVPDTKDDNNLRWGLRTFTTTRGYACVQVGRVQDFQLGLVGRDGAFGDDGRFHQLRPQVLDHNDCVPLDQTGHGFLALHYASYPASGLYSGCLAGPLPARHRERCPDGDLRTLDYGLLGPHATSITYRLPSGEQRTQRVHRDGSGSGAFLIVTPAAPPQARAPGASDVLGEVPDQAFLSGRTPSALTIVSVAYDDGTVCHVDHIDRGTRGGCPVMGFRSVRVRRPRHAEVATRMTLSITREADGRHRDLHVRFRARYPARGARAVYYVFITPPAGGGCHTFGEGHPIARDVRAGQHVGALIRLTDGGCPGTFAVDLSYRLAAQRSIVPGALRYPGTAVASGYVTTP